MGKLCKRFRIGDWFGGVDMGSEGRREGFLVGKGWEKGCRVVLRSVSGEMGGECCI